jgi:hypothetical protein
MRSGCTNIERRKYMLHMGGGSGFIPSALVIFRCNQKTREYYNEINGKN